MAPTIKFTRKGLVIGSDAPVENDGRFGQSTDLVREIDRRVCEKRESLTFTVQEETPVKERDFGRRYEPVNADGTATRTDWFQRIVEGMLLLSFTSLTYVYFM